MKEISIIFLAILICLSAISQKTKLESKLEGNPYSIKKNATYGLALYFMAGFDDSVSIYLNKKLIKRQYVKSQSYNINEASHYIDIAIDFKKSSNILEIKKDRSSKYYFTYLVSGYRAAVFYLENESSVVYTNHPPVYE